MIWVLTSVSASEMTYIVSSGALNSTHSLTSDPVTHPVPGGHVIKVSTRSLISYDIRSFRTPLVYYEPTNANNSLTSLITRDAGNDVTYGPLENEGNTKTGLPSRKEMTRLTVFN